MCPSTEGVQIKIKCDMKQETVQSMIIRYRIERDLQNKMRVYK